MSRDVDKSLGIALDREQIIDLMSRVGEQLAAEGYIGEIAIYGGSALALLFDFRDSTIDIDYVPIQEDYGRIARAAKDVANELNLDQGWLNSAVEIFKSDYPDYQFFGEFPAENPGLRVFVASPQYILAMKMLSMRSSLETNDISDVWHLAKHNGIETFAQARTWFSKFFPQKKLPRRNELLLMDLFSALESGESYSAALGW